MLETARVLVFAGSKPKRAVIFAGFNAEETGLFGSAYFVKNPLVSAQAVWAVLKPLADGTE